jgi:hypothetical protein
MFRAFFNTRVPTVLTMLAFVGCCLMFCNDLAGASDSAELTPQLTRRLEIWGGLALVWMLAFCLCLAAVTRYRRSLPDKRFPSL